MKASEEMAILRHAIEAAGASPALTRCSVLASELATRVKKMEEALYIICHHDDGSWAAGRHWRHAIEAGKATMAGIAADGLLPPEYPNPRSFDKQEAAQ